MLLGLPVVCSVLWWLKPTTTTILPDKCTHWAAHSVPSGYLRPFGKWKKSLMPKMRPNYGSSSGSLVHWALTIRKMFNTFTSHCSSIFHTLCTLRGKFGANRGYMSCRKSIDGEHVIINLGLKIPGMQLKASASIWTNTTTLWNHIWIGTIINGVVSLRISATKKTWRSFKVTQNGVPTNISIAHSSVPRGSWPLRIISRMCIRTLSLSNITINSVAISLGPSEC